MTSSDKGAEWAVNYAEKFIDDLTSTPLCDSDYFDSYIILGIQHDGQADLDDILPSLVAKSETSLLIFRSLKRISAHYILKEKPLPHLLSQWLCDFLTDLRKEPTSGKTGPNKSIIEDMFLLSLVASIKNFTSIPVWPRETAQPRGNILALVAWASERHRIKHGKSPFPIKVGSMEKRYQRACKLLKVEKVAKNGKKS